jgi:hypothetical protein
MFQSPNVALCTNAPQPTEVWSKSGSKEGHFTLEVKTIFRLYLASHCSWMIHASNVAFSLHAPYPTEVWSKSGSKEGHFTPELKTVFRLSPH